MRLVIKGLCDRRVAMICLAALGWSGSVQAAPRPLDRPPAVRRAQQRPAASLVPQAELERLTESGLLPGFPGARAWKLRLYGAVKQATLRGGSVVVGGVALQAFKQWGNTAAYGKPSHTQGNDIIKAFAVQLERLQADFPGLELFHAGGKDFKLIYVGAERDRLAAAMRDRFSDGGAEIAQVRAAMAAQLRDEGADFPADGQPIQFYGGLVFDGLKARSVSSHPGRREEQILRQVRRLAELAPMAGKQAQHIDADGGRYAPSVAAGRAQSSFTIYDPKIDAELVARFPEFDNARHPFDRGVDEQDALLARRAAGRLSARAQRQLFVEQGQGVPSGRRASDDATRIVLERLIDETGVNPSPLHATTLDGGDETALVRSDGRRADLLGGDFNAFGALNGISDYPNGRPRAGAWTDAVRQLGAERGQGGRRAVYGADLADTIKRHFLGQMKTAIGAPGDVRAHMVELVTALRGDLARDPWLSVPDKVEGEMTLGGQPAEALLADPETAAAARTVVDLHFGGRALKGRFVRASDGRTRFALWDPARPHEAKELDFVVEKELSGHRFMLRFTNLPGLSLGHLVLERGDLSRDADGRLALDERWVGPQPETPNAIALLKGVSDLLTERAKRQTKVSIALGEPFDPEQAVLSVSLAEAKRLLSADGQWDRLVRTLYARETTPALPARLHKLLEQSIQDDAAR